MHHVPPTRWEDFPTRRCNYAWRDTAQQLKLDSTLHANAKTSISRFRSSSYLVLTPLFAISPLDGAVVCFCMWKPPQ